MIGFLAALGRGTTRWLARVGAISGVKPLDHDSVVAQTDSAAAKK